MNLFKRLFCRHVVKVDFYAINRKEWYFCEKSNKAALMAQYVTCEHCGCTITVGINPLFYDQTQDV